MKRSSSPPNYDWKCHSCGAENPRGNSVCALCKLPAFACKIEIDAAKNSGGKPTLGIDLGQIFSLRMFFWCVRAWPVICTLAIASIHYFAESKYPTASSQINKLMGSFTQTIGGLLVLTSINTNLGIFRKKNLLALFLMWLREVPIISRSVVAVGCIGEASISSVTATGGGISTPASIEERVEIIERALSTLRSEMTEKNRTLSIRIETVRTELSSSISQSNAVLDKLTERVRAFTVGGVKQQLFGVLLVIYGAIINSFT